MNCRVVTRVSGAVKGWDIAHHLKMGTRDIHPDLNPKPGVRAAVCHSMGLKFPKRGICGMKALIEPLKLAFDRLRGFDALRIRLRQFAEPSKATA